MIPRSRTLSCTLSTLFLGLVVHTCAPDLSSSVGTQFTIVKNSQAVAIVQKALAAMGGDQALAGYQDSEASGTLTIHASAGPIKYPITLKCKGTLETRIEVQTPAGTNVRIANHGQAVIEAPSGTVKWLLANNTFAERVNHIPLLSILGEYQNGNVGVQYQGASQVNSKTVDVVSLSLIPTTDSVEAPVFASTTQTLFYVNQVTGLVDKIQYADYAENNSHNAQKVEVYFGSYQVVGNVSVPFLQLIYTDGTLDSDIALSTIKFNVGLTDDQFALPAKGANVQ